MKKSIIVSLLIGFISILLSNMAMSSVKEPPKEFSEETKACISCHKKHNPGIVQQWGESKHYRGKVGCYECHAAEEGDPDAYIHDDKKVKKNISIIVSPKDCSNCHAKEVDQATKSHHAKAARILNSLDNLLAEVVEGNNAFTSDSTPDGTSAVAVSGCRQCHGSKVKVLEDGQLDPTTWPNTGIGRVNPDGSEGSCTACHARHQFSVEQARQPETCGKCHLGPDHPQKEVYDESKHGIQFNANKHKMDLSRPKWIPGEDYFTGPTCSTCHMGATRKQAVTHDVGTRISWNNRPPVSTRPEIIDKKMGLPGADLGWEDRRDNMKDVCSACHTENYIDNFYTQYDNLVELYNEKFAKLGLELVKLAKPLLRPAKFSNKLDWVWFELWHHEGRRARMGTAMMAPDYTHWHGMYEVAQHFYIEFVPELEELVKQGMASGDAKKVEAAKALSAKLEEILNSDNHKWYLNKLSKEQLAIRKAAVEKGKQEAKAAAPVKATEEK